MGLLIKVFGYKKSDFYFSKRHKSISAIEKNGMFYLPWSPENFLANRFFKYKKWEIKQNSYISTKRLLKECRKLAKTGVKFK